MWRGVFLFLLFGFFVFVWVFVCFFCFGFCLFVFVLLGFFVLKEKPFKVWGVFPGYFGNGACKINC